MCDTMEQEGGRFDNKSGWARPVLGLLEMEGLWHDLKMLTRHSNNGGQPKLWCVELVPKRKRPGEAELKRAVALAKGIPEDPDKAVLWMAEVMTGLQDNREAQFARERQRLVVFTDRKQAGVRARKESNEFWSGKVRQVRII
jgi:hypothetical protein